jgi:hypothetical protein
MAPDMVPLSRHGLAIFLVCAALVGGLTTAIAQTLPEVRTKAADADDLINKASRPTGVRIILTLASATPGPDVRLPSASIHQPMSRDTSGPLRDGQVATVEQTQLLERHLGADDAKRQRWSPRLSRGTQYMAITVNLAELEALAKDSAVVRIHEEGELFPGLQNSVPLIGMPAARAFHENASGSIFAVAIVDTGVEYNHIFIGGNRILGATCFSTADANFATLCPNGANTQTGGNAGINCGIAGCFHGTHVAGIAAGNRPTGNPRSGVAMKSDIFAVQVFRRRIADNRLSAADLDMVVALENIRDRVRNDGARIASVNLSIWDDGAQFPGNCDGQPRAAPFVTVIRELRGLGVATVIISGNGSLTDQSAFPGCIGNVITVSSADNANVVANDANVSGSVDLFAPGVNINSSVPGGIFNQVSGTSMAAPHVAGAIAAIRSACPGLPLADIEREIINAGPPITDNRPACTGAAACGGVTRPAGSFTRRRLQVDVYLQSLRLRFPHHCVIPSPQIPQLLLLGN